MAEWLGKALQKLVQRFESASDLKPASAGFVFSASTKLYKNETGTSAQDVPVIASLFTSVANPQ